MAGIEFPARRGRIRKAGLPGKDAPDAVEAASQPAGGGPGSGRSAGQPAARHVYRVGGLRIPVKNSVRGPKSRCAGRVKDLLRRRAESPAPLHPDPTVIEPPIRKPPVARRRPDGFLPSPHGAGASRGKDGIWGGPGDDDDEDLDEG